MKQNKKNSTSQAGSLNRSNHSRVSILTGAGMLAAVGIILGFFKIPITKIIEIRFGSLPLALSGIMFGPGVSAIVGVITDVGGYLVKPTGPYFPGFTISSALTGVIFALVLYKKKVTLKRVMIAEALHTVLIGMLLNTVWLSILYAWPFRAALAERVIKELVMYPINTALFYGVLKSVSSVPAIAQYREAAAK